MTTEITATAEPHETTLHDSHATETQDVNPALEVMLHECRVEMIPLDDIYVESDQQDDEIVTALADSICHIGLQNPICVVKNDMLENDTPYRLVSGRQRYQAYKSLGQENIPCHILPYEDEEFADERKKLAQYEENLLRKQLTLIETCTLLGKAKEAYLTMYPETGQGKASKKNPGTGRLPYALMASRMLGKSKSTVEKYLQIYQNVIVPHSDKLKHLDETHPYLLENIEEYALLAQEKEHVGAILDWMREEGDGVHFAICSVQAQQEEERSNNHTSSESSATPTPSGSTPPVKVVPKTTDAQKQSNSTPQVPSNPSQESPAPAPSALEEWLARVHDFGAQFTTIVAHYYGEKEANKAAVFQRYKEEMRQTVTKLFPQGGGQHVAAKHWMNDSKDRVECHCTYASEEPHYDLNIHFSLTKAVHRKPR